MQQIPFTCLQFPLYEHLKFLLTIHKHPGKSVADLPPHEAALCGSVAGGIAAAITTPLDVGKTRIMLSGKPNSTKFYPPSLPKTVAIIYREEGIKALFSGVGPRVLWISLGGAVFLGVYEGVKSGLRGSGGEVN